MPKRVTIFTIPGDRHAGSTLGERDRGEIDFEPAAAGACSHRHTATIQQGPQP